MRNKKFTKLFLFLLLSGCAYREDARNPLKLAPASYEKQSKVKKACVRSEDKKEKVQFKPKMPQKKEILSLSEVIDFGLHNNPSTQISWAEARQAAGYYGQTLADFFPQIDIIGNYQRVRENLQEGNLFINYQQTTVTPEMQVNYIVFDFGQRRYTSDSALFSLYNANFSHNREIETVMQLLISDYFDYLYQKELLEADEADLLSAQATLDAANEKKITGVASTADVVQAKTEYLQTKLSFIGQKTNLENSYTTLAKDMGIPANFCFKTDSLPKKVDTNIPIQGLATLIKCAKKNRQDYLASKANQQSKVFGVESAKSLSKPIVTANFDIGKDYYGSFGSKEDYHYTAQVTVAYPLFQGYYFSNLVKTSKASLEQAQAEVYQTELNIIEQVTSGRFDVKMAKEAYATTEEYLATAIIRFKIALANYKAGTNTILDVLAAQSSLSDARAEMSNAKKTWYLSLANLAYATGSLTNHTLTMKE